MEGEGSDPELLAGLTALLAAGALGGGAGLGHATTGLLALGGGGVFPRTLQAGALGSAGAARVGGGGGDALALVKGAGPSPSSNFLLVAHASTVARAFARIPCTKSMFGPGGGGAGTALPAFGIFNPGQRVKSNQYQ
jgi:hypothetical protein